MPTSILRLFRLICAPLLVAIVLQGPVAVADEREDFQAAVEDASARCRLALRILETEGQQETAAAVHQFRQSWQQVIARYGVIRPASGNDSTTVFLDIELRIIGVLLVIDMGNRDAARSALEEIETKLAEIDARLLPSER